jgi:hypothetical protein
MYRHRRSCLGRSLALVEDRHFEELKEHYTEDKVTEPSDDANHYNQ